MFFPGGPFLPVPPISSLQSADRRAPTAQRLQAQSTLQGVYNVNKGYAVFKQIDILYQNEEYTIVKAGTDFGISIYDHIALEGDAVSEDDLIN